MDKDQEILKCLDLLDKLERQNQRIKLAIEWVINDIKANLRPYLMDHRAVVVDDCLLTLEDVRNSLGK